MVNFINTTAHLRNVKFDAYAVEVFPKKNYELLQKHSIARRITVHLVMA
jgi:hypothetical protein